MVRVKAENNNMKDIAMNTYCQVCQGQLDGNGACPNCGPKAGSAAGVGQFQFKPSRQRLLPTSVTLVGDLDRTESTTPFSAAIPKVFQGVARGLAERITDITYDVWTHGDLDCHETPVQLCHHVGMDEAINALKSIVFEGGGDLPETHADQLENLLAVTQWGSDPLKSRNILLMFATDETKPSRSGKSMKQIGAEFKAKGVFLFLVCQETPSLREIVDAAGGYLIPISTDPDEAETKRVVSQLTASITATATRAATIPLSVVQAQPAGAN